MEKTECGYFRVDSWDDKHLAIQLEKGGRQYEFIRTSSYNTIQMFDKELWQHLNWSRYESFTNFNLSFPTTSFISFEIVTHIQTFFKCKSTAHTPCFKKISCNDCNVYYTNSCGAVPISLSGCSIIQLPMKPTPNHGWLPVDAQPFELLPSDLLVRFSEECKPNDEGKLNCVVAKKGIKIGITQQYLGTHVYIHS
jgi:hypothetical protein